MFQVTTQANGRVAISFASYGIPVDDQLTVDCTDCGKTLDGVPSDFLRYDRWLDRWVTTEENAARGTVLPTYGVCKPCQDVANEWHDENRYGGPNHWQIEQRLMEDERFVWAS